jgi:hypothetical protein
MKSATFCAAARSGDLQRREEEKGGGGREREKERKRAKVRIKWIEESWKPARLERSK